MGKIDKNLSLEDKKENSLHWVNPLTSKDISIYGFAWIKQDQNYRRFAQTFDEVIKIISPNVDMLANMTAGGQVHFQTDSSVIAVDVELPGLSQMSRMTITAQSGFDCYIGNDYNSLKFHSSANFSCDSTSYRYIFFDNIPGKKLVVLNFPLYNGVTGLKIGVSKQKKIFLPEPLPNWGRIIFYGTSITQGACAGRPGLCYTNIISRDLGIECLNFGFSGSAFGETDIAREISKIKNARMYIIDYEANAGTSGKLYTTLEPFIKVIRESYNYVPIIVVSRIKYLYDELFPTTLGKERKRIKDFQRNVVLKLNQMGDSNIHFIDGELLMNSDYDECSVDTIHPNDLGLYRIAKFLGKKIKKILNI